ncbi:MAG: small subunit ribosomal protein [Thermacetogenium sp.]|jgi:small subunit ribosomal protein S20|uniref:Small ribosomal subunit protein bS20 n=1 Tax=Thermacetogenium phaeum TaxID=85874 RepID=A0A101FHK1_9THEO|nr:MAG: 30S ribosomal protein S20 [Thermacetogenium phaeum]MDN5365741.1 small subunit ribosomal protein [Thermacetogenium sp.]MDN5376035.1 small subunit ribosomal protein [Thermacetogenium sp.]
MANTKSAIKRAKTARKRQLRNASYKSAMKTAIKKFEAALAAGDKENLEATYRKAIRLIDKVATKGVIHPNTRDRKKSKLARKLNQALA